ncbi:glycoprotein integral membrane protein 1 isoform X2 [Bufo bufo]|uniref:glycoprotein integral membrane protein 1 isoform X2 n=1 Tax=Bufo bufo TaxID=8384 RepID=UPI001ABE67B1|nr:glycoprotein integral membrane protein 1 isoform X2 [Bufo bufo]
MVRFGQSSGPCCRYLPVASLLLAALLASAQDDGIRTRVQETVSVNVTSLHGSERVTTQVSSIISYARGRIHLNGFPVNRGVSRITCGMDIRDYNTSKEEQSIAHNVLVSVRLLVLHNFLNYHRTSIIVQQEVIAIGGNKVNQSDVAEVKLVLNIRMEIIHCSSSVMNLEDSHLSSITWDNDVLFTFPNISESAGDSVPQQTTREYSIGQNTTVDEEPFPGKLPETPIRAVLPASSYKVMCEFADELRDKLCLIWSWLYPVLVGIAQVFILGVIGAAVVIELLKILYPLKEPKWTLQSSDFKDFPVFVPSILGSSDIKESPQETGNIL